MKIYTYSHNRPDFIKLQYETIKRHVKDDYEFIVFNNERPGGDGGFDENKIGQINDICESLDIQCIRVELDPELQYMNGVKMFDGNNYLNGNIACAYSYTWGWKNYISKNDCLSVIIDSDSTDVEGCGMSPELTKIQKLSTEEFLAIAIGCSSPPSVLMRLDAPKLSPFPS